MCASREKGSVHRQSDKTVWVLSRLQSFALDLATERHHTQPGAQPRGADESSVWMRLASQLSRCVCFMISPTQSVSTASNSGCLPRTHQIANAPYEASGPAAENLTVAGLFIRHRRPVGSPKKSSGMRYLPFCCLVIHSRTYGSQFTSRISDASHRIKKSMPS